MRKKVFSQLFFKKILGLIKAIGSLSPPALPCNGQFGCCVHILRGPWLRQVLVDIPSMCTNCALIMSEPHACASSVE